MATQREVQKLQGARDYHVREAEKIATERIPGLERAAEKARRDLAEVEAELANARDEADEHVAAASAADEALGRALEEGVSESPSMTGTVGMGANDASVRTESRED